MNSKKFWIFFGKYLEEMNKILKEILVEIFDSGEFWSLKFGGWFLGFFGFFGVLGSRSSQEALPEPPE